MHKTHLHEYRNALFQGELQNRLRQGPGLILTDDFQIIIGTWLDDRLEGLVVILEMDGSFFIFEASKNEPCRWLLYFKGKKRVYIELSSSWRTPLSIIGIDMEQQMVRITRLSQNSETEQQSIKNYKGFSDFQAAIKKDCLSGLSLDIEDYLQRVIPGVLQTKQLRNSRNIKQTFYYLPSQECGKIGFVLTFSSKNKQTKIESCGEYNKSNQLHGRGISLQNPALTLEGNFKDGKLEGYGCKHHLEKRTHTFAHFRSGDIRNLEAIFQNGSSNIRTYRQQMHHRKHLSSMWFCNEYLENIPSSILKDYSSYACFDPNELVIPQILDHVIPEQLLRNRLIGMSTPAKIRPPSQLPKQHQLSTDIKTAGYQPHSRPSAKKAYEGIQNHLDRLLDKYNELSSRR